MWSVDINLCRKSLLAYPEVLYGLFHFFFLQPFYCLFHQYHVPESFVVPEPVLILVDEDLQHCQFHIDQRKDLQLEQLCQGSQRLKTSTQFA